MRRAPWRAPGPAPGSCVCSWVSSLSSFRGRGGWLEQRRPRGADVGVRGKRDHPLDGQDLLAERRGPGQFEQGFVHGGGGIYGYAAAEHQDVGVVGGGQDVEGPGEGRRHSVPEGLDLRVGEQAEGATGDPLVEGATTGDGFEAPDEPASAGCRGVPQGSVADLAGDTVAAPVEAAADDHTGGDPRSQADVDDVGDLGPVPSDMAV